MSHGEPLESSL